MLNLMYITNRPDVARIAESAGIDWIFVDMEFIGKKARQGGLDTVQNHHTVDDIKRIKQSVTTAKVLVRVNPIHGALPDYPSSRSEIDQSISAGADIVMLPFFKTAEEVREFVSYIDGRAKTCLLVETAESAKYIDEILEVPGIDMVYIGLNDLHLAMGMSFMFELLADGTVDILCNKIKSKGLPYGFGGLASLDGGALPGRMVLKEHYRLGSSMVIISRSFCNTKSISNINEVKYIFTNGIREIRKAEQEAQKASNNYFSENRVAVVKAVDKIINK